LKKGGKMIANTQKMNPMPVITGAMEYPENIEEKLSAKINLQAVDALSLAEKAGTIKAVNVVLIGLLAKSMDVDKNVWIDVIKETVPEKFLDVNIKAFELGYEL
jgi:indolepyruvate oxidoreductase II beta subunit